MKKIGKVSFYCPERGVESHTGNTPTFGLSLLCDRLKQLDEKNELSFEAANETSARSFDILFVTLYWWKDVYALVRFLRAAGINPANKKPLIVCGGISALNPLVLTGFCNHVFCGDVDDVVPQIYDAATGKSDWQDVPGVYSFDGNKAKLQTCSRLYPWHHTDERINKITRIEIARGCKHHCAFCVIGNYKPYVELPTADCVDMIKTAPTKTIGVFAPDRGVHSGFVEIEAAIGEAGKNNLGSDIRLDILRKHNTATQVRFGLEGYSHRLRKHIGKPWTNEKFIELFLHAANDVKKPSGKPINSMTMYLISGLPGQEQSDVAEFWDTMRELDSRLDRKIQLFISQSQFIGFYHTPMQYAPHDLHRDYAAEFGHSANRRVKRDKDLKNIVIAHRGGSSYPVRRLMMLLTVRGDERAARAIYNIALHKKYHAASMSTDWGAIKPIVSLCKKCGIDVDEMAAEKGKGFEFPWMRATETSGEDWFYGHYQKYKQSLSEAT